MELDSKQITPQWKHPASISSYFGLKTLLHLFRIFPYKLSGFDLLYYHISLFSQGQYKKDRFSKIFQGWPFNICPYFLLLSTFFIKSEMEGSHRLAS